MSLTGTKHTKVGPGLFSWRPWVELAQADDGRRGRDAQHLWLLLYASAPAKLLPPGLWLGGIGTMADHARMSHADTVAALDLLVERELVEYDQTVMVARLTMLPDRCEAPTSPNTLRGWWGKYQTVTDCGVRRRYLDLLIWLTLPFQASKRSEKEGMKQVWDETFGALLGQISAAPSSYPARSQAPATRSAGSPKQLDLSLTPDRGDMYRDMSGEGEGKGREEGRGAGEGLSTGPHLVMVQPPDPVAAPEPAPPPAIGGAASVPVSPAPARESEYRPPEYLFNAQPLEPGEIVVVDPNRRALEPADVVAAHELWGITRDRIRQRMQPRSFDMWIEPIQPVARDGPILHLSAPQAVADCVRAKHQHQLEAELHAITGHAMQIAI